MTHPAPDIKKPSDLARVIDHTALKPDTPRAAIETLCDEARQYGFASVCVNPTWVPLCAERLSGSDVDVCTVIGFPLGATLSEVKAFEAKTAIARGATEVDMVINVGALKSGDLDTVQKDIRAVVDACPEDVICKVIIETCLLSDDEKRTACEIAEKAGADFVKTSTGFAGGGATVEDIRLMRSVVGDRLGVKASGGVRTTAGAMAMIEAGATRIGASAGVTIVSGD